MSDVAMMQYPSVAPLVGAWIEINTGIIMIRTGRVAPLVGAWIEIRYRRDLSPVLPRRSPRGSVD